MKKEQQKRLLLDLVQKRAPEAQHVAEAFLSGASLTDPETDLLIGLIGDEFISEGLDADDEPTALGHDLETLLDDVNRLRLQR